jgi:hypothetical protein
MLHLPSLITVPLTRTTSGKTHPCLTGERVAWLDEDDGGKRVMTSTLPGLQAMFRNVNAVPVTPDMVSSYADAFALLTDWQDEADVSSVTRYSALVPAIVKSTARWSAGAPSGENFPLVAGEFLWVRFGSTTVMDLGLSASETMDLPAGVSALAGTHFPQPFSAHRMIRQLGLGKVTSLRVLDAASGRWLTAEVRDGRIIGHDFAIRRSAVVLVHMASEVTGWRPE